jgi:hypothetical protein
MPFLPLTSTDPDFFAGKNSFDPLHPRLLIFTEGTILGPRHWWEFFNDRGYVTINLCAEKIRRWYAQGARIAYLTSRRRPDDVTAIAKILTDAGLPGSALYYRGNREEYHHIAENLIPDVLIEDDCAALAVNAIGRYLCRPSDQAANPFDHCAGIWRYRPFAGFAIRFILVTKNDPYGSYSPEVQGISLL